MTDGGGAERTPATGWFGRLRALLGGGPHRLPGDGRPLPPTVPPTVPPGVVEPPSGSTSFHCWWQGIDAPAPIVEVAATLEVIQPPTARRLYFWALQASFSDGARRDHGAAHIGLQWNPRHRGSTAVNWGGYGNVADVQSVLDGSPPAIPSTVDDRNTRDFPWRAGVPYRFRIGRAEHGWRGDVTDTTSGATQHIRDLYAGGDRLTGFVMWSELFCACTDPPVTVRWSDLEARDAEGAVHRPVAVRLTFPGGGCTNTDTAATPEGIVQRSGAGRTTRDGTVLRVPSEPD